MGMIPILSSVSIRWVLIDIVPLPIYQSGVLPRFLEVEVCLGIEVLVPEIHHVGFPLSGS